MKKVISVLLVLTMMVAVFAGCGGGAKSEDKPATGTDQAATDGGGDAAPAELGSLEVTEPIEIEWWHALENQYEPLVERLVADFESKNPNIKVKAIYQGSYSDINEKLAAAQVAGSGLPALVVANTPYIAEYSKSGLCEPLDPFIEASGFEIDDFGEGLIQASSYEGVQTSLPFLISTQIMFYNKDMIDAEGIKLPETWDDMDAFVDAASKVEGGQTTRYATAVPGWDQWYFETFFLNNGVNIVNEDQVSSDLNSEKAVGVTQKFQDWYQDGKINWMIGEGASSDMRQGFIDGKYASVIHTTSLYNLYLDNCDFEVGMHYLPGGEAGRKSEIGGCVLLIPAKNDDKTKVAAWHLLNYLTSKDVNMTWAAETGYMPTRNSVLKTDEAKAFLAEKPAFESVFAHIDDIMPRIQHPGYSRLAESWKTGISKTVIEKLDPQESMNETVSIIDEELADSF